MPAEQERANCATIQQGQVQMHGYHGPNFRADLLVVAHRATERNTRLSSATHTITNLVDGLVGHSIEIVSKFAHVSIIAETDLFCNQFVKIHVQNVDSVTNVPNNVMNVIRCFVSESLLYDNR